MNFVLIICLIVISNIKTIYSLDSLKLVQIVQRHGDRTPTNFYTNDPHKDEKEWPEGLGEMTNRGKTRMFQFGQHLRDNVYKDYLTDNPREVSVRSSALTRTLESAECFMAGMYKPKDFWIWDNNTDLAKLWQPIAINTVLAADDGMLRTSANCPKADQLWQEFMQTNEVKDYLNTKKKFIQYLSTKTGDEYWSVEPSPLRPLEFLSTTLRVERENNKQMPDWVNNTVKDILRDLEIHAFYYDWKSPDIQRLRAGLILKELTTNMINRADEISKNKTQGKNVFIYETHDVNQVVLMQALNVYESPEVNRTPPTYTASLIFELHQINGEFVVKLVYFKDIDVNNTLDYNSVELKLDKCSGTGHCNLEEFIKSVDSLIPSDWEQECERISIQSYTYFNYFSLVYILSGVLLSIICYVLFAFVCRRYSDKEETNGLDISTAKRYSN